MGKFFIGILVGIAAMRFGPGLIDAFNSDVADYTRIISVA